MYTQVGGMLSKSLDEYSEDLEKKFKKFLDTEENRLIECIATYMPGGSQAKSRLRRVTNCNLVVALASVKGNEKYYHATFTQ